MREELIPISKTEYNFEYVDANNLFDGSDRKWEAAHRPLSASEIMLFFTEDNIYPEFPQLMPLECINNIEVWTI